MKNNKSAILAVSFGTSFLESKEKTIDRIEMQMQESWPDYALYRAWTSKMIIRHLDRRDGLKIDTVGEAMEQMGKDGIREIVVQPTHVINGVENDLMKEDVLKDKDCFAEIRFGTPLLTAKTDYEMAISAVMEEYAGLSAEEGLVWMGHGTTHYVNAVYAALDYMFKDMGYPNVFVGTVEAYPTIENVMKMVQNMRLKKIHLAPFMVVAGDHANHDMAGEKEDSWKSVFEKAGYEVECHLKGLGEFQGIRNIYLKHLREALEG